LHSSCVVSGNPSTTSTTSSSDSSTIIRGHIISADSVQVYRANTDIGSNKPSAEELLNTPYHLVGIVDPPNSNKNNATKIETSSTTTITTSATALRRTILPKLVPVRTSPAAP
jgi:tRNA A37 N6-isopentenylltransferase MiaA